MEQDREQPPTEGATAASDIPPESGPDDHIEPSGQPFGQPAEPQLSAQSSGDGRLADRDIAHRRDVEAPRLLPTDLGSDAQPAVASLPGSADIVRALRPLKRKVPSWREDEVVLDEEATAEQAVQDGLWWPVTIPDKTRWLDLTLVVDSSPSMALWQSTVKTFISLSQQVGAFRTIQLRLLDTHRPAAGSLATPV
ncbi:MAG: hypothetical protein LC799_21170, partial [Actinobacteria bacterium]|nr:hypothetical protein [Actinomycetota bacterium]